jgi:hypothetical protein
MIAANPRQEALFAELRGARLGAPERLRARVLAAEPAPARFRHARVSRRRALVLVPAVLTLALVAAVVDGIVQPGGGSQPQSLTALSKVPHGAAPNTGAGSSGSVHSFGAVAPNAAPALPSVAGSSTRIQHADATLDVQVAGRDALSRAVSKATRIASSLGGWAQSVDYGSTRGGSAQAQLELRVPEDKARVAVQRLGALGTIVSQEFSLQDLQQRLQSESQQIAQLRRRVDALAKAVADPSLPDAQRVLLRIKLAEARRSLAQATTARTGTLAAGSTASLSLTLSVKPKGAALVHHRGRFGRMVHRALGFLELEGLVALYALLVAGPLALLAGAAWWLARERRRREERTLLSA